MKNSILTKSEKADCSFLENKESAESMKTQKHDTDPDPNYN